MRKKVAIISLFLIVFSLTFSPISISPNKAFMSIYKTKSSNQESKCGFFHEFQSCYSIEGLENVSEFKVFCHLPIAHDGQVPIIVGDVWSEPADRILNYRFMKNYWGSNALLEFIISNISKGEKIRLFWTVATLIKEKSYRDLPDFIEIVPRHELPENITPWLKSTKFIQSNHVEIIATAQELAGSEANLLRIADNIANFTANGIKYHGPGRQDALSSLQNGYAVCTGKANLVAALLRANGIPARVLMVYSTHFIVEYYAPSYGWIRIESTHGRHPQYNHEDVVLYSVHPDDETETIARNGQSPDDWGVIAFWGTSDPNAFMRIDYSGWVPLLKHKIYSGNNSMDDILEVAKATWNCYSSYIGCNLLRNQQQCFDKGIIYQESALNCLRERNFEDYHSYLILAHNEYSKIDKIRGIAIGSDIIGDESSVQEILSFVHKCKINFLIVDFGWITWSWSNSNFEEIAALIDNIRQDGIPIWLMYRARTIDRTEYDLPHQVYKDGTVSESDLCFSHEEVQDWSINWTEKLLLIYPHVDGMILYNPRFFPDHCFCNECCSKFRAETGILDDPRSIDVNSDEYQQWIEWRAKGLTNFITEWNNAVKASNSQLQTGAVLIPQLFDPMDFGQDLPALGKTLDAIFPFVVVHNDGENGQQIWSQAQQICNEAKDSGPSLVIANIKIYGPYNNTDNDVINAMNASINSRGDGFFVWCYDYLVTGDYNLTKIMNAFEGILEGETSEIHSDSEQNNGFFLPYYVVPLIIGGTCIIISLAVIILAIRRKKG